MICDPFAIFLTLKTLCILVMFQKPNRTEIAAFDLKAEPKPTEAARGETVTPLSESDQFMSR
jgi:hypothetical protein